MAEEIEEGKAGAESEGGDERDADEVEECEMKGRKWQ